MKKIFLLSVFIFVIDTIHAQDTMQTTYEDLKIYPLLWQQTAAEYRALCYQAFNTARMQLNEELKKDPDQKNLAIITDLDETILDNSNITAQKIKTEKDINYNEWLRWLNKPGLPTVPGGVEFLQYAGSKGVHIFYISNRNVKGMQITLGILQKLNLPDADTNHILLLTNTLSKESRRQIVMQDYNVLMLLGDNLNDFMQVFEEKPINERFAETDSVKTEWGKKFIVLPNAAYGEWENALYNCKDIDSLSAVQKITILKDLLKDVDEAK